MPSISSAGVGSGLDIQGIISSLMAAEQGPLSKLKEEKTSINTKISIYGIIRSSFDGLRTAANDLTKLSKLNPLKATSSDEAILSASATSIEAKGSYSLEVSQLAKAQSVASPAVASSTTSIGTGSLTITLGSYNSGTNTFTANASKTPVTVTIGTGNQTLEGVKQAINDADAGVKASIVNDGTGSRLVLTSKETGADLGFKMTVTDDDTTNTDTAGLSQLAYDPTAATNSGKNASLLQTAQNALFKVNNLSISKSSNTVTDAIEGVTLNLKAVTTSPVNLDITTDDTALKTTLDAFVTAYNKIRGNLKDQQQKDATLSKETTPSSLERGLRRVLNDTVSAYGLTLSDIGMSFDKTGVLSLNKTTLDEKLKTDPKVLEKLFSDTGTTTDARVKFLGNTRNTVEGTFAINVSTAYINGSQTIDGTINGVAGTATDNVLVGATGDASEGLRISVDENVSGNLGTVTFSNGLASRLTEWIDSLTEAGGALASRTDGLNSRLKKIASEEDRQNLRLDQLRKRYTQQFTALDALVSRMQGTSAYLSQQLAALSASN